jgi:hypothetical protein
VEAYSWITEHILARAGSGGDPSRSAVLAEIDFDEPDLTQVAAAIRRVKARRGLDDDQLAEVLGRSVDWVRHTLAFGARHPEGEDRLTIRPGSRSTARELAGSRVARWRP